MSEQRWRMSRISDSKKFESGSSMYFPYAEKFMAKFPWLAVRVFYILIKIKEFRHRKDKRNE